MMLLVIFLGGGTGSVLRFALSEAISTTRFPVATLVTNLLGCLLLGLLIAVVKARPRVHRLIRPALGTGLLGGFTTFSTFAIGVHDLSPALATAYVAVSLVGGLICAEVGEILAEWFVIGGATQLGVPSDVAEPSLLLGELDIDPDLP